MQFDHPDLTCNAFLAKSIEENNETVVTYDHVLLLLLFGVSPKIPNDFVSLERQIQEAYDMPKYKSLSQKEWLMKIWEIEINTTTSETNFYFYFNEYDRKRSLDI